MAWTAACSISDLRINFLADFRPLEGLALDVYTGSNSGDKPTTHGGSMKHSGLALILYRQKLLTNCAHMEKALFSAVEKRLFKVSTA